MERLCAPILPGIPRSSKLHVSILGAAQEGNAWLPKMRREEMASWSWNWISVLPANSSGELMAIARAMLARSGRGRRTGGRAGLMLAGWVEITREAVEPPVLQQR